MEEWFSSLTYAVKGNTLLALGASVLWGILSILLSPCHLASIPLLIGYIHVQGKISTRSAFITSFLFSAGILFTIGLLGVITALAGRMLGDTGDIGNYIVAGIFFIVGLYLLDVISFTIDGPQNILSEKTGYLAAFLLGLIFGIALGPCTYAFMAPVLAVTFKVGANHPHYSFLILLMYGIGHCSVIVLAGTFTGWIQKYLNWTEHTKTAVILKKICGILVLLAGIYIIYRT